MSKNILNLFAVFFILTVITACICQSNRKNDDKDKKVIAENINSDEKNNKSGEQQSEKTDNGDFIVENTPVENPQYEKIDEEIREDKTLEKAADQLNRELNLPNDIYLRAKDCKEINAYYDPRDQSVTVCYELMEHYFQTFKSAGYSDEKSYEQMFDAVRFAFLHEIGHALIDNYKLPIMGNEEDAADRCSGYINLEELGAKGVRAVLAAADAFRIESRGKSPSQKSLADEHLLNEQRFYNSLCMIYGSNPDRYSSIVEDGYLPKERADKCPNEYERTVDSWKNLLEPWRKK